MCMCINITWVFFFFKMGFDIGKPTVRLGGATWNPRSSNPAVASTPRLPESLWGREAVCIFSFLIKAPGHKQKDKEKAEDWFGGRLIVVNSRRVNSMYNGESMVKVHHIPVMKLWKNTLKNWKLKP